jgi:tRNA(Ile)-lysidine synthase
VCVMKKSWEKWLKSTLNTAGYEEGDILVLGVSGGADSLALLHWLGEILGPDVLHVAHLDHGIRPASHDDAKFVAGLAESWRIPFSGKQVNVPELATLRGWSLEEAARNARYDFLAEVARSTGASIVVVGHNADDQAETVLLHLLRGSGLSGLRGMQVLSPFPSAPELKLLRPLLQHSRADIEAYCHKHALFPLVDETNTDPTYLRNRIRHQLLPDLATYNLQIKNHLQQLAAIATAEDEFVGTLFDDLWPELLFQAGSGWLLLNRHKFRALPTALQRRAVRRAVYSLEPAVSNLSFKAVEQAVELAIRRESGTETRLLAAVTMLVDYETLLFARDTADRQVGLPQTVFEEAVELPIPGRVELANGWVISAEPINRDQWETIPEPDPWLVAIQLPQQESLYVRPRMLGERMQPLGMDGRSSSLQDIMVNRKLAARLREKWPLVITKEHVVWLPGHIIDRRARITDNSRRLIRLTCEQKGELS